MELVDHDTHESLIAAAAEGRRVIAATRQQAIEAKGDDVNRGKITAAWLDAGIRQSRVFAAALRVTSRGARAICNCGSRGRRGHWRMLVSLRFG
jgi:hypothetical protein